ncbi:MAG: homoserine O-succinyltransferase [Gemmatimonadota bacterium]|nr:homoserine O-succinyltransferase [Gemmatimonadota bacterium]
MPLVAHSGLPTFSALKAQGHELLTVERARHQDIRELHIGFLNMMPDAALRATERQFIRLVGACNRIAQFYVYPFTVPGVPRGPQISDYIDEHYSRFEDLREDGLDALIITGANVANPEVAEEPFWDPLVEVVDWAREHVTSVFCSCLATHALVQHLYEIERQPLPKKKWGVYSHRVHTRDHPIMREINTRFDVPHSRHNDVSREQFESAGLVVLVESEEAGVHMATSPDQFRFLYLQGHPEYDVHSLLKEYKREAHRFLAGEIPLPPPFPEHYFTTEAADLATAYLEAALHARDAGDPFPETLERDILPLLDNTWGDTAKAIVNNWLGLVYQLTDMDRRKLFMPGVDPDDPLGILARNSV